MQAVDAAEEPRWRFPSPWADGRLVGGVAGGIARELGLDPLPVRIAFVVLTAAGGWGALLYAVTWSIMVLRPSGEDPGVPTEGVSSRAKGRSRGHRLAGFVLVVFGLLLFFREIGGPFVDGLVWPVALFGAGIGIAHEQGVDLPLRPDRLVGGDGDRSSFLLRVAIGGAVVLAGVVLAVSLNFDVATAWNTFLVVGVVVGGLGLVLAPWVNVLVADLGEERRARIHAVERERVAAHLHDSVLQTLSLIQRRSSDPAVVALARRQERELRGWLWGRAEDVSSASFRVTLEAALAAVEELYEVPVEVVVVGDGPVDDSAGALVAATREAVTNAANHAQADRVDVFAEVTPDGIDVFVRDTGVGFDPGAVSEDRRGIADSISGRLDRVGGGAVITSAPGAGTEVEMWVGKR